MCSRVCRSTKEKSDLILGFKHGLGRSRNVHDRGDGPVKEGFIGGYTESRDEETRRGKEKKVSKGEGTGSFGFP